MKVKKRDGRIVLFDKDRILGSIKKAFKASSVNPPEDTIIYQVIDKESQGNPSFQLSVEEIQDRIINWLKANNYSTVATNYETYREEHRLLREHKDWFSKQIGSKLLATDVENSNANMDENSFGGRMGEAASVTSKEYALNFCMSRMARDNHLNNEIYIHDLSSYAVGSPNCLSLPLAKLLAGDVHTGQTDIRPANSLSTALQLLAVYFQIQSLQQFGGVAATSLDWDLVPYVRKSFYKHWRAGFKWLENKEEPLLEGKPEDRSIESGQYKAYPKVYEYAREMLEKEAKQSVEALIHNLNSLQSRSGNQLPFSSINLGTCTLPEGRLVIKAVLKGTMNGTGKYHKTPIFPCLIFKVKSGVNKEPNTPNYDMFKLALQCTSKRMYPNYANCDWSVNNGYDQNDPHQEVATMGCLAGHEHLYVKIDGKIYDVSIEDFYYGMKAGHLKNFRPAAVFFKKERKAVQGNKHLQEKSDITPGAGVYSITYKPLDISYIGSSSNVCRRWAEHKCSIHLSGGLDAGPTFGDTDVTNYEFKVLEYTSDYKAAEKTYIESNVTINYKGASGRYYKDVRSVKLVTSRPTWKITPGKQSLINLEDRDIKVLDIDNNWVKVKHVFKNDKFSSPYMMHIYYKEFDKKHCISATEDHPFFNGKDFTKAMDLKVGDSLYRADGLEMPITAIGYHRERVASYDIGTESGTFVGSDIKMHNCRTYNGYDINGLGYLKDGRGNICPVTIILPTIAMEAKTKAEDLYRGALTEDLLLTVFFDLLTKKLEEAKDMLIERFEYICSQPKKSARFCYENDIYARLPEDSSVRDILRHGTLALGSLGLAETLQLLIGKDHTTEAGMDLAKKIYALYKHKCAEYKTFYHLNFGVYYSPAESLCWTAMKAFKEKYGVIPNVSDREYFTNSMHVPVWREMSPFTKIDIESQLTGYSSAGCITYVELSSGVQHNLEALEQLVLYAMNKDIPYFAINIPIDDCQDCGASGEFGETCPECGSTNIKRLRRVTGYLSTDYRRFNLGKQAEVEQRIKHLK